ncbi:hypothetical protein B0H11DRAFT_639126 [Mycena galericulata]|nr:hypothetical protein B0H11DRAFT_639126 [Mycena galericulata]
MYRIYGPASCIARASCVVRRASSSGGGGGVRLHYLFKLRPFVRSCLSQSTVRSFVPVVPGAKLLRGVGAGSWGKTSRRRAGACFIRSSRSRVCSFVRSGATSSVVFEWGWVYNKQTGERASGIVGERVEDARARAPFVRSSRSRVPSFESSSIRPLVRHGSSRRPGGAGERGAQMESTEFVAGSLQRTNMTRRKRKRWASGSGRRAGA